ncbi:unnamed protein product [Tilletia controversa]|uniref:Uncharacterized protein n=3 Tax=Tilletia TaxID=13289 RepID=A0A8X7MYI6_9BASI|nr:hypothetical protein CF336_g3684 [Tilletia laevis]KAE8205775.1 hypothetical protein CF328_g295 [Tilletia controversa]KAE8261622.1 hypothetical protein A4X03_0g3099 [Tilletia caries]KAE8207231.1 hypothetical protein CF335_g1295 [Tilletia laevis]KAE8254433.1 hypothetical protein A4X06_0g898 [Tilletia controversa]
MSEGPYAILPLVDLTEDQRNRLDEEIEDVFESGGCCLNSTDLSPRPFLPGFAGRDFNGLVSLALSQPEDTASGGKFLSDFFGLAKKHPHESATWFLLIDERGAKSLTEEAEEAFNVLASELEQTSLQQYLTDDILGELLPDIMSEGDEELQYLEENPPAESSAARLRLKSIVEKFAQAFVQQRYGDHYANFVTFRWNVNDVDAVLTRKEGEDADVLTEVKYFRMSSIRSELFSAADMLGVCEVKDPLDMFAYLARRAFTNPRGIATEENV